jgi:hypothetical protein
VGKYLKLVYDFHEQRGTLDAERPAGEGDLNVFDLGAVFVAAGGQGREMQGQKPP